jgi:hypothetical protein
VLSSIISHPSSALLTGRTGRNGRKALFCRRHLQMPIRPEAEKKRHPTTKAPRHQGKNHREDGEVREESQA